MDLKDKRDQERVRNALKRAKAHWGTGWMYLSTMQRQGAVALEIIYILNAQDEESAPPALVRLQNVAIEALGAVERESLSPVARRSR